MSVLVSCAIRHQKDGGSTHYTFQKHDIICLEVAPVDTKRAGMAQPQHRNVFALRVHLRNQPEPVVLFKMPVESQEQLEQHFTEMFDQIATQLYCGFFQLQKWTLVRSSAIEYVAFDDNTSDIDVVFSHFALSVNHFPRYSIEAQNLYRELTKSLVDC